MFKCIIVDDELPYIEALQLLLKINFADSVTLIGVAADPGEAALLIARLKPDIVFFDGEMPIYPGIELLQSLTSITFHLIFTTNRQPPGLPAGGQNSLGCLLKPTRLEELSAIIKKYETSREQKGGASGRSFSKGMEAVGNDKKISIHADNSMQFVPINDIIRIESRSNYSTIHFVSRTKKLVAKTLKEFEHQLTVHNFLRVHHSHLINLEHVVGYRSQDGGYIIVQGNDAIEISRRRKSSVLQRLSSF